MSIALDVLGFAHPLWPLADTIKFWPDQFNFGAFDDPFGPVLIKAAKLFNAKPAGWIPKARIHAHWGMDANGIGTHTICPLDKLKKKLPSYESFAKDFPHIAIYISHSCEYNEQDKNNVKARIDLIHELAPSVFAVNSPGNGVLAGSAYTEKHFAPDSSSAGEIYSLDGSSDGLGSLGTNSNHFRQNTANALFGFLWAPRFNFRENMPPGVNPPPPLQRKAAPSVEYFKGVCRLGLPEGRAPKVNFTSISIKDPYLWKPFSEDHYNYDGRDDPRENRPVLIVPSPEKEMFIIDANKKKLGSLINGGTYGNYTPALYRFYSGVPGGINLYGFQIGNIALKNTKSEFVWFTDGKNTWGPVNPAFRMGSFK